MKQWGCLYGKVEEGSWGCLYGKVEEGRELGMLVWESRRGELGRWGGGVER